MADSVHRNARSSCPMLLLQSHATCLNSDPVASRYESLNTPAADILGCSMPYILLGGHKRRSTSFCTMCTPMRHAAWLVGQATFPELLISAQYNFLGAFHRALTNLWQALFVTYLHAFFQFWLEFASAWEQNKKLKFVCCIRSFITTSARYKRAKWSLSTSGLSLDQVMPISLCFGVG